MCIIIYIMDIYTIGHSTRTFDDFLDILYDHGIETLVDVRSYPRSKIVPQFNISNLEKKLPKHNIEYIHMPFLGGFRKNKPSYVTKIRNKSFASYAEYMLSDDFAKGIGELKKNAKQYKTVFMCTEVLWYQCHRRMISDKLTFDNWNVYHIGMGQKDIKHEIWDIARIDKYKQVIYDKN